MTGSSCDENPLAAVCCTDYKPGTNMLDVDWGISDAQENARFAVAIQAIGDFSGAATAMVTDLGTMCRNMAVELGEDPKAVDTNDPGQYTTEWCQKAVDQIATFKGNITITYQEPQCSFSAEVQAGCEGHCDVSGSCDPGTVDVRCTGGELTVKCEGSCSGHCDGSANVAVNCEGACSGSCEGQCDGTASSGSCAGTCSGKCRGSCEITGGAMLDCDGECRGSCMGTATAPKCTGELDPPSCDLDADCEASCKASASAKAECTPPAVEIEGDASFAAQIAVLKKYLPGIITIGEARADILLTNAQAMVSVSGNLSAALSGDGKAVFCIIPAAASIADAVDNINVSLTASGAVVAGIE